MKQKNIIKLLPLIAAPFVIGACTPTEHHTVNVYEYTPKKTVTKKAPSDNPRDFTPVGLGTGR
jgi:hypothetical protein